MNTRPLFINDKHIYPAMRRRPNTPGHNRYLQAAKDFHQWECHNNLLRKQGSEDFEPLSPGFSKELEDFTDLDHYGEMRHTQTHEHTDAQAFNEETTDITRETTELILEFIMSLADGGSSQATIGIAIYTYHHNIKGQKATVSFTRIPRHPDWMGMSPLFSELAGTTAFVFQEPGETYPNFVIITNNQPDTPVQTGDPFPEGESATLRDLLAHAGATPGWIFWNGDWDNHPYIPVDSSLVAVLPSWAAPVSELPPWVTRV